MIYFLLPAFNEVESIQLQLQEISDIMKEREFKIYVVDDGSTDGTAEEVKKCAEKAPVVLLSHETNLGPGTAFKTGFKSLLPVLQDDDVVITLDLDMTQQVRTVRFMLQKIDEGYEVIIGSVFTMGGMVIGLPWTRYVLSYLCNLMYRIIFFIKGIHDYTGFFRAHSGGALKKAFEKYGDNLITTPGFAVMAEMLVKYRQIPLFITEVPMIVRYDLKKGRSKMNVRKTANIHFKIILENMFKRRIV